MELELEGRWAFGLEARASYTFQHSRNEETGLPLTNSPVHLVQLNVHRAAVRAGRLGRRLSRGT